MCKNHYKESSLRQSNNDELSQSNNDAQQGAIVLAAFSGHFNNREINSNVCNEKATGNNVPAVSHQQNINTIVECVADNNTTVSRVELQPAAENVIREHELAQRAVAREEPGVREHKAAQRAVAREEPGVQEHELAQRAVAREEPGVREHESAQQAVVREEPVVEEHESAQQAVAREEPGVLNGQPSNSSSSQSYIATLENRISFIETQNQNLQMRITTLEQTVKNFMDTNLALSLPSISVPQFSVGHLSDQFGNGDALIGTIAGLDTFKSLGQQKRRIARTHGEVVTRCNSQHNAGLKNSGSVCYSNAIFQAFASCNHRTTLFDDPPQKNHERTPLCYEFAKVLHSLVKRQFSEQDVVDPSKLINLFMELHDDFVDVESEYC